MAARAAREEKKAARSKRKADKSGAVEDGGPSSSTKKNTTHAKHLPITMRDGDKISQGAIKAQLELAMKFYTKGVDGQVEYRWDWGVVTQVYDPRRGKYNTEIQFTDGLWDCCLDEEKRIRELGSDMGVDARVGSWLLIADADIE
eukprot:jgi/Mesvir1/16441/Mv18161-RA.1